ncbi:MAG: geranyl transferase [Pelagibacteraceae bacterium]|nr:geranyl transferase [Pelagibacteraceae bacterium]|tara:strand:+ start:15741 stop:16622 length:882 start_codon:yes stop_codon:yes gene_type:complete
MDINILINNNKATFDKYYLSLLKNKLGDSILSKAMIYGSMSGGKRIRPFLLYQASKIANISKSNYLILASCVESIHSYSLIHDDLPSMDNDDYRRGKLSTHKKFNEATAILAGDALHDLAFELISEKLTNVDNKKIVELINFMSKSIGFDGLAGGQSLDLLYERKKIKQKKILEMYNKKTAKLFEFAFSSPFLISKNSKELINFSKNYGSLYGLLFQIIDDYIDEKKSFKQIGKTPGKDKKQQKSILMNYIGKKNIYEFCNYKINKFKKKYSKQIKLYPELEEILFHCVKKLN